MKYYKVEENELKDLIESAHRLLALEHGGVDNWIAYSDSFSSYMEIYMNEHQIEDDDDFWFEEIVENELKDYEEISE